MDSNWINSSKKSNIPSIGYNINRNTRTIFYNLNFEELDYLYNFNNFLLHWILLHLKDDSSSIVQNNFFSNFLKVSYQ